MTWNLYENSQEGVKFLEPLKFSNGKTQEDVVKEVLDAIKQGEKIIFIHGMCGTGKSVIALNIAKNLGKSSVVVPGKTLQQQYKNDYGGGENKYILKGNNEKLKISVITGRNNHKCKFLEDNRDAIPQIKKEINSRLNDIFDGKREEIEKQIKNDQSADNSVLPCKIDIKEKNFYKIKEYLRQNKKVNSKNFNRVSDVKRMSIAPVCPYWSPVMPEEVEIKNLDFSDKRVYKGLKNKNFVFYIRKSGCGFYEQFNDYIDSDVIVFNSLKYKLESALNRKPMTEVEIIDECDEFLDSFSNQRKINLDRLQNSVANAIVSDEENFQIVNEISEILKHIKRNKNVEDLIRKKEIVELKRTGLFDLFKIFLNNSAFMDEIDEESYVFDTENTIKMFGDFLDETYVIFERKDGNLTANIVTINLAKKFREMIDKNKVFVLMSGTIHSDEVLREVFGLEKFRIIEAEKEQQGKIKIIETGMEIDCKYSNFSTGKNKREEYLLALDKCIEKSEKPVLIHVNSFGDMPDESEKSRLNLNMTISREQLTDIQKKDKEGNEIKRFKKGEIDILFSTKCARGVDFPGDECKSIIFTKYPNPNVQDPFWKILNQTNPSQYWGFYKDKARRELLQKIYRGLRFKNDEVFLLSPDSRVIDYFKERSLVD